MSTVNNMQIQDNEGNVFHPETSIEQIVGENGTQVFPGGKPGNMESSDMTAAFDEVKMRENIKSGEKHRVLFGKIQKFFADLKTVAFSGKYGDLSERPTLGGAAGYKVADNDTTNNSEFLTTARVAYEHGQEIDALSRDLGGLSFGQDADGNWGYKVGGADSVTPFKYSVLGSYIAGSSLHNMKTGWLPIDFCDTNIASLSNGELIFKKSGLLQVRIMASISVDNSLENNIVQLLVDGITHVQKNLKGTTTSIEIESSIPVSVGTRVGCKFKQETGRSFYCMSSYIING